MSSDLRKTESVDVAVTPAASGRQLVRYSLPFPKGFVREGEVLEVSDGRSRVMAALRPLSYHPGEEKPSSVRRGLVTFPYEFKSVKPVRFELMPVSGSSEPRLAFAADVVVDGEAVSITYRDGPVFRARLVAPRRTSCEPAQTEIVESNSYFTWTRVLLPDSRWPRVIEVRADVLGGVTVIAHLQRNLRGNGYAPAFGWKLDVEASSAVLEPEDGANKVGQRAITHKFEGDASCAAFFDNCRFALRHPTAQFKRRGLVTIKRAVAGRISYRYLRSTVEEKVPMQQAAWRKAEFTIAPAGLAPLAETLEYPHAVTVDLRLWDELYGIGSPLDLCDYPELAEIVEYHREAIRRSAALGDDWGNVTMFHDGSDHGAINGMNRLNLCIPIFEDAYRAGDGRLLKAALLWCENFHDLTVWWGPGKTGGTRYPNVIPIGKKPPHDDRTFQWRTNGQSHFCTKGFYAFLLAYEHTGDPRMLDALKAQVAYTSEHVRAGRNGTRNVGCVLDFVRLYRCTGERVYLDQALRLFRELRNLLSTGDLFTESGRPIYANPPFIEDDSAWRLYPFAKPYILGYALSGLPELIQHTTDEPKLRDVVQAVADFLTDNQDPLGGWRYPHPRSSLAYGELATEGAWQLAQADKALGVQPRHLDAIERALRQRILPFRKTGTIFSALAGWEVSTGKVKERREVNDLYEHPESRDYTRDYDEGELSFGRCCPDGSVRFVDTLRFYAQHRPLSRLLEPPADDEPLGRVMARVHEEK
ncbi:MAG: hypothetical protein Q7T82_01425 [Armatimonadota bacterium]|nr:hypothetical protein [Armatimonadota bacterium]